MHLSIGCHRSHFIFFCKGQYTMQPSNEGSPQQNRMVERKHLTHSKHLKPHLSVHSLSNKTANVWLQLHTSTDFKCFRMMKSPMSHSMMHLAVNIPSQLVVYQLSYNSTLKRHNEFQARSISHEFSYTCLMGISHEQRVPLWNFKRTMIQA